MFMGGLPTPDILVGKCGVIRAKTSPRFEIVRVLVCLDHVATFIVNANHGVLRTAEKLSVVDCVADLIRLAQRHRKHCAGEPLAAAIG
jgi:hypothetical protein